MEKKRFLKRKILFIALEILWLVSSLHTWSIAENTNDVVSFEWQDKNYSINAREIAETVNINIDEYPFYIVVTDKQRADIIIYYSKTRFVASTYFDNYAIGNGQQPVFKITVQSDGRVTTKNTELNGIEDDIRLKEDVRFKLFIASNQDLLLKDNKTKAFEQNSGYIYDISNEKEDKCEEIVKIKNETIVYERAAMNHNEMTTLVQGSIVKRIKKEVNVMNGHTWDKIVLANGKEGYVFSENLAIAKQEEYSKVSFEYNPLGIYASKYEIYFPTLSYDINIQDYPHYIITADNKSKIRICYSTEEFNITAQSENYRIGNKLLVLMITLEYDGRVSVQKDIRLADSANSILIKKENFQHNCIAANQDIFYENEKIFSPYICEGNVWYRTNVNWDDITMSKGNYNTIKEKEEEFSSVEDVGIAEEALLLKKETLIVALKSVSFVFPHASSALDYFLTLGESGKTGIQYSYQEGIYKAGHTVRLIPINNAIEQNSSIKERLEKNINEVINVAEKMNMSESTQLTFSRTTEDSGIATKKGGLDWHATLNQYRIRMQCAVEKNEDNYQINMKYGIIDYYDWEEYDISALETLFQGTMINVDQKLFDSLNAMHRVGIARNYTNYGEVTANIVWNTKDKENTVQYSINK